MTKILTKTQEKKIRKLAKVRVKGKPLSQQKIAKALNVRKLTVSTFMQKAGLGVRAAPKGTVAYWKDVKTIMDIQGLSRSEASEFVGRGKKWGTKRAKKAGKKWSPISERQKWWIYWKKAWKKAKTEEEKEELEKEAERWKDEEYHGDTPA